jgi:LSD1 subclass zinc finger protein
MPTTMSCPGCQTPLRLREDMGGKKIKCPRCGQVITVPAEEIVMLEAVEDEEVATEPLLKPQNESVATRSCPECGERIAWTARTCRHCHAELDDDEDEEDEERFAKRSKYKPCPRCGEEEAKRVVWTPWGSFYGPALLSHVRCPECGYAYNGKSGRSNLIPAIIFVSIPLFCILAILAGLGWYIHHLGYF